MKAKKNEFERKKEFYEKMLGEDGMKNLEDLKDLKIEEEKTQNPPQVIEEQKEKPNDTEETTCPYCNPTLYKTMTSGTNTMSRLKKKENPALLPPSETFPGFVCCMHHSKEQFNYRKGPKNIYKYASLYDEDNYSCRSSNEKINTS